MLVKELLKKGRQDLAMVSDSPDLDMEILTAKVLSDIRRQKITRAWILAHPEEPLTAAEKCQVWDLIKRRMAGEPIAYIISRKNFFGQSYYVDPRVLIPRPETETLVEEAIKAAGKINREKKIGADIGTGSGCIVCSLALNLIDFKFYGTDISEEALEVAVINIQNLALSDRIQLRQGNLLEALPKKVDLLTANLPYIARNKFSALPREVRDYEPRGALFSGADSSAFYRAMIGQLKKYLRPGGYALFEIEVDSVNEIRAEIKLHLPGGKMSVIKDGCGLDRVVKIHMP